MFIPQNSAKLTQTWAGTALQKGTAIPSSVSSAAPPIQVWIPNQPQATPARSRAGTCDPASPNEARASSELLAALPPRYGEVLLNLLDRLESSALFSEESCSFSQKDLLDNLQAWADKARAQLPP